MSEDAKPMIEQAARRFVGEVHSLAQLKMVFEIELRGKGDTQQFRLQMPDFQVSKGPVEDAMIHVDMQRSFFNVMAKEAKVADWIEAFTYGKAHASGPEKYLKLIGMVVERQQERDLTRRATKH